jgi:hypothetical protein
MLQKLALLVLCSVAAPAAAQVTTTVRSYAIPGEGALELAVPMRWTEEIAFAGPGEPTRITLRPSSGGAFAFTIAVHQPDGSADFNSRERLRSLVEESAKSALALRPETDLRTEELRGARSIGFVYSVTDSSLPDPAPEGFYRVITQGAFAADDLLLVVTILTQKSWGVELDAALDVLRSARQTDHAPDAWRLPGVQPKPLARRGGRYRLELPEDWTVLSENPLEALSATGGRLDVTVEDRTGNPADELRRLVLAQERRSQDAIMVRKQGKVRVAGVEGRQYEFVDTLRDVYAHQIVICPGDVVITISWSAHPKLARAIEGELETVLEKFELLRADGEKL